MDFSAVEKQLNALRKDDAVAEPTAMVIGCWNCGGQGLRVAAPPRSDYLTAARCSCATGRCAECGGSGSIHTEEGGYHYARACRCSLLDRKIRWFAEARIPRKYAAADMRGYLQPQNGLELQAAAAAGLRLCSTWREGARGLLFHGPVGTGKTHLLVAMLRKLIIELGVRARFVEFTHLLSEIRATFGKPGGDAEVVEPLIDVPVLALDELGKGRADSQWVADVLDHLISRRYSAGRTTLFTTNFRVPNPKAPPEKAAPLVETLEERVGARIYSRLSEMTRAYAVNGTDLRRNR